MWRQRDGKDVTLECIHTCSQNALAPNLRNLLFVPAAPGIVTNVFPYPGYCDTVLQNSHNFRVRVRGSNRTSRNSGYGYGSLTELPEVPGNVAREYRTHRSSERV